MWGKSSAFLYSPITTSMLFNSKDAINIVPKAESTAIMIDKKKKTPSYTLSKVGLKTCINNANTIRTYATMIVRSTILKRTFSRAIFSILLLFMGLLIFVA